MALPEPEDRVLTRCGLLGRVVEVDGQFRGSPLCKVVIELDGQVRIYLAAQLEVLVPQGAARDRTARR